MHRALPVLAVLAVLTAIWYLGAWRMNTPWALAQAERAGVELSAGELFTETMRQERPRLPAPHQVAAELWKTTGEMALRGRAFSKRSLIYHGAITLGATLTGFALGVALGILGAVAITYSRVAEMSLMPWAIVSQTIPIVALAPMIIVLSNAVGIEGRTVPKAIISAYLCYFPVLVGMVKGLNSPSASQLDLLKTYNASGRDSFFKLRLPASMPYLFTSLKVAIAAALVGTIVGELPTGAISGLGARILIGDQFGTPLAIWAALFAAAILAGLLVTVIGGVQALVLRRMGMAR
ncbi:ABC transporter permease [Vannielia litorea]|uniref:ABC transporter permease n=1 Tax=Vannielia litorea TaxID=1217970 RepID=UPI001C977715|nr:ABC transporter permease subunit [Vannielia litorea]MBY6046505.1 ABC transporter permease subunit [Vannielia litorea]MBY6073918.1 ABC transporter permease subunit [Vannielia litorea]